MPQKQDRGAEPIGWGTENAAWSAVALAAPAAGVAVLAVVTRDALSPWRWVRRTGDFGGHTLYLSFIVLAALLMLWRGVRSRARNVLLWPVWGGLGTFL